MQDLKTVHHRPTWLHEPQLKSASSGPQVSLLSYAVASIISMLASLTGKTLVVLMAGLVPHGTLASPSLGHFSSQDRRQTEKIVDAHVQPIKGPGGTVPTPPVPDQSGR